MFSRRNESNIVNFPFEKRNSYLGHYLSVEIKDITRMPEMFMCSWAFFQSRKDKISANSRKSSFCNIYSHGSDYFDREHILPQVKI